MLMESIFVRNPTRGKKNLLSTDGHRWGFFRKFIIPSLQSENYLTRWRIIQTPWFGVYLHRFGAPDPDRHLHDHPYNFLSFIFKGGYSERHAFTLTEAIYQAKFSPKVKEVSHRAPALNWRRVHEFHRIATVLPGTMSLVFVGRRQQDWGFATEQGWVMHQDYLDAAVS